MSWFKSKSVKHNGSGHVYSFTALRGKEILSLADFKGKVILIVNTASRCGFTSQYKELEALYLRYKDQGLVIIGVPSNDFAKQEPGNDEEIASFCEVNYGVSFPMTSKEHVIGKKAHPFYQWARKDLGFLAGPKWNFHKYLLDKQGNLVDYFYSNISPTSPKLVKEIEKLIAEPSEIV